MICSIKERKTKSILKALLLPSDLKDLQVSQREKLLFDLLNTKKTSKEDKSKEP